MNNKEAQDYLYNKLFSCEARIDWSSNIDEYKMAYQEVYEVAKTHNLLDYLFQYKLEKITGFCGTNNQDFSDFVSVIKMNNEMRDRNEIARPEYLAKILNLGENYINLIYCVLYKNECLEYGTSLQSSWLTDLGKETINPELGPEFIKFIEKEEFR